MVVSQIINRPTIIGLDEVGVDGLVDVNDTQPSVVRTLLQSNFSGDRSAIVPNCTGTLINPRTVITAAHCLDSFGTENYGQPGDTGFSILVSTGVDSEVRLNEYIETGAGYADGGVAISTDLILHPSTDPDAGGLPFPWADVALVALDAPITDVPSMPILLSPITQATHVVQVGYGRFGVVDGIEQNPSAAERQVSTLRRIGENTLDAVGSYADFFDIVFPELAPTAETFEQATQPYYFTDFDNPDRTPEEIAGCRFSEPGNFVCDTPEAVAAIDFLGGDALPNEVTIAGGDSGGPLIVDELYDFDVVIGVASGVLGGAFGFESPVLSLVNTFNPLYPFFEFISENTPYKYVSAKDGGGVWSAPDYWTQDLDPGFFIDDGNGNLVNGLPQGSEPGIFAEGPKFGSVLGFDLADRPSDPAPFLPPSDTPDFGSNIPESSVLIGPGSTGFVPQNTDGVTGALFANPAQYFEVHLNRLGVTTVDIDVEIDRFVIADRAAAIIVPEAINFTSLIGVEQLGGRARIDGTLNTPVYTLAQGTLTGGGGTLNTDAFFNINGLVNAGLGSGFGTLSIDGNYVQSSGGTLWADFSVGRRRDFSSDFYDISGAAVLDGNLVVSNNDRRLRFGTEFTVLSADEIDGDFSQVLLLSRSPVLDAVHRVEGNDVVVEITARSLRDLLGANNRFGSLGGVLDTIRASRFNQFAGVFDIVDNSTVSTIGSALTSLAPLNAFNQTFTAIAFNQRFVGQIAQRHLTLRGGSRSQSAFLAGGSGGHSFADGASGSGSESGSGLAFYGTATGAFLARGNHSNLIGDGAARAAVGAASQGYLARGNAPNTSALEEFSIAEAGELTMGADMSVSDGLHFGFAMSSSHHNQQTNAALQPQQNRSTSLALYGSYTTGRFFADGYAGTAWQRFGAERAAQGGFEALFSNSVSDTSGRQTFGGLRAGYDLAKKQGLEVGPIASLDYTRSEMSEYEELGASALGLRIAGRSFTSLSAKAGAIASADHMVSRSSRLRAFGSAAYSRELADNTDVVTATFAGARDLPFTIANALDTNWIAVNAGLELSIGAGLQTSLSFSSDIGRGILSDRQGSISVGWRF